MASPSAWMPIYLGDYLGKTARLTTEQHGAYLLLLFDYWRSGPPPNDDAILAQITRLSRPAWKKMKPTILAFFNERDGKLFHNRVEEELEKAEENKDRRTERAKTAAAARWSGARSNATSNARSNATSMPKAVLGECPPPSPKSSKAAVSRAKACPADWKPDPFAEGSEAAGIVSTWADTEVARQLERFIDHHRAKGSRFVDWQAAWGTWVRNSVRFGNAPTNGGSHAQRNHEDIVLERIERERRKARSAAG